MKNQNIADKKVTGFTLIELIIVILVASLLGVLAYQNKDQVFGKMNVEKANNEISYFIDGLQLYKELNSNLYSGATVQVLRDNGYINEDYTDGSGENVFSNDIVISSINSGADAQMVYTMETEEICNQLKQRLDNVGGLTNSCSAAGVLTLVKS